MKKELIEIVKENKPKVLIGTMLAGLALATCDVQKVEYYTLAELRAKDNSPENRYKIDYGGKVKWLIDNQTGSKWTDIGKKQCLEGTDFDVSKTSVYVDDENVLHVKSTDNHSELKFEDLNDTSRRLAPADSFTANYLNAHECQVTDY